MTPADLLNRELARDAARPFVTWYDDSADGRVELSLATTANWVAKIAGLLTDEHDVEPGVTLAADLPLHWQTVCVLLAVWSCGAAVALDVVSDLTLGPASTSDIVVQPDPMGMSLSRLVAAQPDRFAPVVPVAGDAPGLLASARQWSHDELGETATQWATRHGIDGHSRVLSTHALDTPDGLVAGLLGPLAAGASVVLVNNADQSRLTQRCEMENVTHTSGVSVPGVVRLD